VAQYEDSDMEDSAPESRGVRMGAISHGQAAPTDHAASKGNGIAPMFEAIIGMGSGQEPDPLTDEKDRKGESLEGKQNTYCSSGAETTRRRDKSVEK
jgi:hypothetical protein